jgi:hypothetical protein
VASGVGRSSAGFGNNHLFNHPLQIPLQAAAVYFWAQCLEILDGGLAVLD